MRTPKAISLANHEIVTLAVYLLGGHAQRVDTEDVAVKANALAPGRFTWRKYASQINLDAGRMGWLGMALPVRYRAIAIPQHVSQVIRLPGSFPLAQGAGSSRCQQPRGWSARICVA